MPRRERLSLKGVAHHIIQRGDNRSACFYAEEDCQLYLKWLGEYAVLCDCRIHAYVLMINHVHLLLDQLARAMGGKVDVVNCEPCAEFRILFPAA